MSTDKLKRVRSIRKWLEKAEHSYSADREISGELNLIMAQAEMKRLKETDPIMDQRKNWFLRGASFLVAICLFSGVSYMDHMGNVFSVSSAPETERFHTEPEARGHDGLPGAAHIENIPEAPAASPAEAAPPVPAAESVSAVHAERSAAPVLSEKEIQSVVGEAGRALRGRS